MSETEFIVIIRPTFMKFCKDACMAASFNHLLYRLAYKCKDQPKEKIQNGDILWYASNKQITTEMSNAWGVCKVGKEVNALVNMNLLGRRSNPTWGVDRTKHFFFGKEQCKQFISLCEKYNICIVHLDLPPEVVHLIYSSNANDKSIKCSCPEHETQEANDKSIECKSYNHSMHYTDSSNAFDKSIEAITKITTKITNKEEDTYSRDFASAQHDTPTPLSLEDQLEAARQLLLAHGQTLPPSITPEDQPSSEFSTPIEQLSPESVDKFVQTVEETSAPPQASKQSPIVSTTTQNTPDAVGDVPPSEKPARPPRPRKPKVDMKPLAPPSKPDPATEWSVEKMMAWGDYGRGFTNEPSNHPNSGYYKALMAAKSVVGRGITEKEFLIHYFNWMKGISVDKQKLPETALVSDYWIGKSVDLWIFNKHFEAEKEKREQARMARSERALSNSQEPGATMRTVSSVVTRQPGNQIIVPEGWSVKRKKVVGEN